MPVKNCFGGGPLSILRAGKSIWAMAASWQESRRRMNGLADFADHDTGSIVWNASLVLLNHLRLKNAADFRGKRVLELGAGVGHLAWGLYELGAHVTASNTPLAGALKELETCLDRWLGEEAEGKEAEASAYIRSALNNKAVEVPKVSGGSIRAVELTWGQAHWQNSPLSLESAAGAPSYDIIILAEVFSIPELHEELVWTLQQFCHADVVIFSMFMNRPFSFMFFTHIADAGGYRVYQYKEDEYDVCGLDVSDVDCCLHRITYDPLSPRLH